MTRREARRRDVRRGALALAIERGEWERIVLHLFVAMAEAARARPDATIDDLIDMLSDGGRTDAG